MFTAWGGKQGCAGQELAGQSSLCVSNARLVATLQQTLSFGAAVRTVPGPWLLINTNWVNAETISFPFPFTPFPPQRQLR